MLEIGVATVEGFEFIVHATPARAEGEPWSGIGALVGMSAQAAQQRYRATAESA